MTDGRHIEGCRLETGVNGQAACSKRRRCQELTSGWRWNLASNRYPRTGGEVCYRGVGLLHGG